MTNMILSGFESTNVYFHEFIKFTPQNVFQPQNDDLQGKYKTISFSQNATTKLKVSMRIIQN